MAENEAEVRRASIDPDRCLPGENPDDVQPGDAEHWVNVYTELLATKRQLVNNLRELMEGQSQAAREELERADVRMLTLQMQRFERRLGLWRSKLEAEQEEATLREA